MGSTPSHQQTPTLIRYSPNKLLVNITTRCIKQNDLEKSRQNKNLLNRYLTQSKSAAKHNRKDQYRKINVKLSFSPLHEMNDPKKNKTLLSSTKDKIETSQIHRAMIPKLQTFDRFASLPLHSFSNVLLYSIENFSAILSVSTAWYNASINSFADYFNKVENNFIHAYSGILTFHNSYLSSTGIHFGGKVGNRLDRVICFEANPCLVNKYVIIGYSYSYYNDPIKQKRNAIYKFEVIPNNKSKIVWIHKTINNGEEEMAYSVPTAQIKPNDVAEIAINFSNLCGLVDADTIEWMPIRLQIIATENTATYSKDSHLKYQPHVYVKMVADLERICEVEDEEIDWVDYIYVQEHLRSKLFDISKFNGLFLVKSICCSGADILISKHFLIARNLGTLKRSSLGIPLAVIGDDYRCRVEVKMCGLVIDRQRPIEIQRGDVLIFYYSSDGMLV